MIYITIDKIGRLMVYIFNTSSDLKITSLNHSDHNDRNQNPEAPLNQKQNRGLLLRR